MEDNVERIVKLLQLHGEKITKEEEVYQGTYEENNSSHVEIPSMNMNDLIGFDSNMVSNQGCPIRGLQLPMINMRKFDDKDPITCIFQMEKFFDLHLVSSLQKVTIASLYLELEKFVWYQWHCEQKKDSIISWYIFTKQLISYHDDKNNTFFSQLVNLKKKGLVVEHIQQFQ